MRRNERLAVWLHGRHIAWLTGTSLRPRLEYLPDVVAEYGAGAVLLSLSLPLQSKPITGPAVLNFFDGLLPEGQIRAHLSDLYKIPPTDIKGLLAAVGADCAGAVQVLPEGNDPAGEGKLQPMSQAEIVAAVESLPTWDLPADYAIATSLGGVQSKILLSREGGRWYWPSGGAASTHIIKPDQSTAVPSRLAQVAAVAAPHTRSPVAFKLDLLRAVGFNLLIGNGDAHSKNYSVLIRETGEVMLAPLYDAAPTLLLHARSTNAGHAVAGQARLDHITLDHLVREAESWGVDPGAARTTVSEVFSAAAEAQVAAPEGLEGLPPLVAHRASDLLAGRTARRQS